MKAAAACVLVILGVDALADAVRAYREGRYRDALQAFTAAEADAGANAGAELLFNKALAALRAGEPSLAESAADRAAAKGGADFAAFRDFLRGNIAFLRCEKAELQAFAPLAPASAFDPAIAFAEAAADFWRRAALLRTDWPEARRNAERALLKVEELRKKKDDAAKDPRDRKKNDEERPNPPSPDDQPEEVRKPVAPPKELTPDEVRRLWEALKRKDAEKAKLRRLQQQALRTPAERDW